MAADESYSLKQPINFTDPYVFHDSNLKLPVIAQLFTPNDMMVPDDNHANYEKTSSIKTNGILYPLIQLNTKIIDFSQIEEMVIYYDKFLPYIKLVVFDDNKLIQHTDIPGLNNTLNVVMVPEVQNTYKNISLEFRITSVKAEGEHITYYGEYKILPFNKKRIKELQYIGCPNVKGKIASNNSQLDNEIIKCNPADNPRPNTWELLHNIAAECNLGFCSTDECQNIEDRLPRLIYNENYSDFIQTQLEFSGLDENSVFDAWVDLYGYIILVNVSWVLNNEQVNANNLAIYTFGGVIMTDNNNEADPQPVLIHRTLTNFTKTNTPNNMIFVKHKIIVDNSDLKNGTSVSMYNFELLDINNGNNSINQYDVEVTNDAIDDQKIEEYSTEVQEKLIIECNDLPINKQKLIREKFFTKHRQRILELELERINFGLQRGTLVNVVFMEDDKRMKQFITSQNSNVFSKETEEIKPDHLSAGPWSDKDLIDRNDIELPNMGLTGMYYIDSMRFEYNYNENQLKQYVRLIKKCRLSNISNFYTAPKLDEPIK